MGDNRTLLPIYGCLDEVGHLREDEKWTMQEIATHFGCSRTVVRACMRLLGYPEKRVSVIRQKKKCKHCGYVYTHCELILGIPKCPQCWHYEDFEVVNKRRNGNGNGNGKTKDDIPWHLDKGCKIAEEIAGNPVTCQECPFMGECIEQLQDMGKLPRQNVIEYIMAHKQDYLGEMP